VFAQLEADALIDVAANMFNPAAGSEMIRYRRMRIGENEYAPRQYSLHGLFKDYTSVHWDEGALSSALLKFEAKLADLADALMSISKCLGGVAEEGEFNFFGDLSVQALTVADSVRKYLADTKFVLLGGDPQRVYWMERMKRQGGQGEKRVEFRLVAAPLSVAEEMRKCFYDVKDSVVLCSATLRVGDKFDYMARRLGCVPREGSDGSDCRTRRLVASSPFDYFRQALVMATDFLPDPASEPQEYIEALAPFLAQLFDASAGRGLVLFTAYDMMRKVAELARPLFEVVGVELYVQGEGLSRESMTARLKAGGRVVLFGSQSFWEGVDVAGEALSCVVLARLPFPQKGEPVTEARSEQIEESGGSSFRDYMVPEAVIKFRQGFGRLVRTRSDRGVVVVTDRRIISKNYGAIFRKSIATSVHSVSSKEEILANTSEFLG
jgi:ATP-dependent DNA helicase DinG